MYNCNTKPPSVNDFEIVTYLNREYVDESLNTIKFAERAKHIVTEVKANKIEAADSELIGKLQTEVRHTLLLNLKSYT